MTTNHEPTDQLAPSWVAALNAMKDVSRDNQADTGTYVYRYADLASACQQARAILTDHDLAVQQFAHSDDLGSVSVTTTVWHISGQSISSPPLRMPAKGGPQDVGSAISYARRYALMAFLGLATDDDDGAGAQQAVKKANAPHHLSERVGIVQKEMRALPTGGAEREELTLYADGKSLSAVAMLGDEVWLATIEAWLDENKAQILRADLGK